MEEFIDFNLPKDKSSIIKVIGVGGGGGNAVNHMFKKGIRDVDFVICNTDNQALDKSGIPVKIRLGRTGLGAGSNPEVGKQLALDNSEQIKSVLDCNTKMLFITAGMGGGTGTGAAPIIAEIAKDLGILTVGIVTTPFYFEGKKRRSQAESGINELKKYVDALLVISNDKLRELHGNQKFSEALAIADEVLTIAAKSIAEIITVPGYINVDFEDVKTVMKDSGTAIMGYGMSSGVNRAAEIVTQALESPLLNDNSIKGASKILLYLTSGTDEISQDEIDEICCHIQDVASEDVDITLGYGYNEELGESISATVIATGLKQKGSLSVSPADVKQEKNPFISKKVFASEKQTVAMASNAQPLYQEELTVNPIAQSKNKYSLYEHQSTTTQMASEPEDKIITQKENINDSVKLAQNIIDNTDDRISKLQKLQKLQNVQSMNVDEMEKTPAYLRRKVELNEVASSEKPCMSNTVVDNNNNIIKKKSNSFIHPDVD